MSAEEQEVNPTNTKKRRVNARQIQRKILIGLNILPLLDNSSSNYLIHSNCINNASKHLANPCYCYYYEIQVSQVSNCWKCLSHATTTRPRYMHSIGIFLFGGRHSAHSHSDPCPCVLVLFCNHRLPPTPHHNYKSLLRASSSSS